MPDDAAAPLSLQEQTIALGKMLKSIADEVPSGVPSPAAAAAFASWTMEAGPGSRQPGYFADVADNYVAADNSNRDLWELFHMLESHIEVEEEDWDEEPPRKTFIGLPLLGQDNE